MSDVKHVELYANVLYKLLKSLCSYVKTSVDYEFMGGLFILATTLQETQVSKTKPLQIKATKRDYSVSNLTPLSSASTFYLLQLPCWWICYVITVLYSWKHFSVHITKS